MSKTETKSQYEVTRAREIAGAWREVGTRISMYPNQAKYYLSPYGTGLKKVAEAEAPSGPEKPAASKASARKS